MSRTWQGRWCRRHDTIVAVARPDAGDQKCACRVGVVGGGERGPLSPSTFSSWTDVDDGAVGIPGRSCSSTYQLERDRWCAVSRPEHQREGRDLVAAAEAARDVWSVMAGARTGDAPRTLAAAQDAVFRRYLPMARTLANSPDPERRPVDPVRAQQAAELGLAQAVLGWRRPDGGGFELFASIAVAAQLDSIPR